MKDEGKNLNMNVSEILAFIRRGNDESAFLLFDQSLCS
jgi:hypothetical protein